MNRDKDAIHRLLSMGATGVVVGILFALADLVFSRVLNGNFEAPGMGLRLGILGLLPFLAGLFGMCGTLVLGNRSVIVPAVLAWFLCGNLASGPRASQWFLADWWSWLGAVAALFCGAIWLRISLGVYGRLWRWFSVTSGLFGYVLAAFTLRGLYRVERELVITLAAVGIFASLAPLVSRCNRVVLTVLLCFGFGAGAAGFVTAGSSQSACDWAWRACSANAGWSMRVRSQLAAPMKAPDAASWERSPFFGTPLDAASRDALGAPPKGVLLIFVDAWRHDMFGVGVTSGLDRLGERSVVFDRAYSGSTASHMALYSALSGMFPSRVVTHAGGVNAVPLLTDRLRSENVSTRASFPRMVHNARSAGFRRFDMGFDDALVHGDDDLPTDELFDALRPPPGSDRWFSYGHIAAAHAPYDDAPASYGGGGTDRERYVAELKYADDLVMGIIRRFEDAGLLEDSWVVVAADHGEEFKEHGEVRHGRQLFEETVRVPLFIVAPGVEARRVSTPVSLMDLAPTLDHAFALKADGRPAYDGRSWIPLMVGMEDPGRSGDVLAEIPPLDSELLTVQSAIIGSRWKFIVDERQERQFLFDLEKDPGETRNLAELQPDRARGRWALLQAMREGVGSSQVYADLDPTLKFLEILDAQPQMALSAAMDLAKASQVMPKPMIARFMGCLAVDGDLEVFLLLANHFASESDAVIADALVLLGLGSIHLPPYAQAAVDVARRIFLETDDPFLVTSIYWVLGRLARPELLDLDHKAMEKHGGMVRAARALYEARLSRPPSRSQVEEALRVSHPWTRRMGIHLLAFSGWPDAFDRLTRISLAETPRGKGAVVEAVAALGPAPEYDAKLLEFARSADELVAATALGCLGRRQVDGVDVARVEGGTLAAPFETRKTPSIVGLWLRGSVRVAARPVVTIRIGAWTHRLAVPRSRPGSAPLVVSIPAGVGGRLEILPDEGAAGDVLFEGFVRISVHD